MADELFDALDRVSRVETRVAVLEANQINLAQDMSEMKKDLETVKHDTTLALGRIQANTWTLVLGFIGIIAALLGAHLH